MERMRAVGIDGPLRTWVAPVPQLSVEAQAEGSRWHVPVPDTSPQEWGLSRTRMARDEIEKYTVLRTTELAVAQ